MFFANHTSTNATGFDPSYEPGGGGGGGGGGQRGIFAGGQSDATSIEYITMSTLGNSTDFGDMLGTFTHGSAVSSSTRAVFLRNTVYEYITMATAGNAVSFGSINAPERQRGAGSSSNETRGIFWGGYDEVSAWDTVDTIEYITIASTGNGTNFGNIVGDGRYYAGGCAGSSTRGLFIGGEDSGYHNRIDYVSIDTTGNSADFGDLTLAMTHHASCSNSTRAIAGGGYPGPGDPDYQNNMDYITIATTGNAADFGDLLSAIQDPAATASSTRGLWAGGYSGTGSNVIQYVEIATTGNSSDFGDLLQTKYQGAGISDGHGGL